MSASLIVQKYTASFAQVLRRQANAVLQGVFDVKTFEQTLFNWIELTVGHIFFVSKGDLIGVLGIPLCVFLTDP